MGMVKQRVSEGESAKMLETYSEFLKARAELGWIHCTGVCDWADAVETHTTHMIGEVILLVRFFHWVNNVTLIGYKYRFKACVVHSIDFDHLALGINRTPLFRDHQPKVHGTHQKIFLEELPCSGYERDVLNNKAGIVDDFVSSDGRWLLAAFKRSK